MLSSNSYPDDDLYQTSSSSSQVSELIPQKNQISTAIYQKYHAINQIKQQDEQPDKDSMIVRESIKYNYKENKQQQKQQKQKQIDNNNNSNNNHINNNKKKENERKIIAKIKNLDTGEQQFIYDDQDQQQQQQQQQQKLKKNQKTSPSNHQNYRYSKITQGLNLITRKHSQKSSGWSDFWSNIHKNNEQLRYFTQNGMYDQVEQLLKNGKNGYPVEINYKSLDDWTSLHYACYQGHDDVVELLLKHGANVNSITKFKRNSLHIATLRGYLNVVKILYKFKIDYNAVDQDGNTALHFAAEGGYKDIVQFLLSIYCILKKNKQGKSPIDDCCDQSLKNVFLQYGFKQNGDYEEFKDPQKYNKNVIKNKLQHRIIPRENLTPDDFLYYKMLGKGSFGEVFLVRKKNQSSGKLYAMKVLSKDKVMTKNLKRYALTQRNVMSVINHPFMAKLFFAFQTTGKLFLIMDYYPGGDLGKLINRKKQLPQQQARKYICQLTLAFQALHKNMIVFRDLKPDNVVLDSQGHVRLTDFGLSKEGIYNNTTESFCGSVAYLAPEILSKQGHSRTVDWYLLGLVLYQLIVGLPPYYNSKKQVLFENIKRGPLKIPKSMSNNAKDLIKKLLCRDPRKRLGANKDSEQIKQHPFFEGIDWQQVFNRKLQMPPIEQPKINLNDSIKVTFAENQNGKKIDGWTFINKI